jgi:hypothetical protein
MVEPGKMIYPDQYAKWLRINASPGGMEEKKVLGVPDGAPKPSPSDVASSNSYLRSTLKIPPPFSPSVSVLGRSTPAGLSLPPRLQTTVTVTHVYRFLATSAAKKSITPQNLLSAIGGIGDTNPLVFTPWSSNVKLLHVTVWPSASPSFATGAELSWTFPLGESLDSVTDRSIPSGLTVTGAVTFVPPSSSLASFWQSNSGTSLFDLTCSQGSIVDVRVAFKLSNALLAVPIVSTASSSGAVGYTALDGPGATYTPIGLPQVI